MSKGQPHNLTAKGKPQSETVATLKVGRSAPSAHASRNQWLLLLPLLLILLLSIYAHARVATLGEDYRGLLAPFDRGFDLLLTLALVGTTFCVGRRLSRSLSLGFASVAEEMAISIMLGVGIVGLLIFALGMAGLFKPLPIGLLFLLLIGLTSGEGRHLLQTLNEGARRNLFAKERRLFGWLFVGLLILLVMRAALPPHAVDEAIYHLAAPKDFVQAGRLAPLFDNFSGNMPALPHMFYVVCLIAKADSATRLFSLSLGIATGLALYGFGARLLTRRIGVLAMFGFFGAGMVLEVAVTARVDVTVAGMLFVASYAMMIYFETDQHGWLYVSALVSGFSLGSKYTAGAWIALLGVMYVVESLWRKRQPIQTVLLQGAIFLAITLAVFSPWVIKNYLYFKSPLYPFVTGEVAEYGAQGVRFFNGEDEQKMEAYFEQSKKEIPQVVADINKEMLAAEATREIRHPFRFWEFFTRADVYNMGAAEGHHDPNYLFLMVPLLLVLPKRRWLVWLAILSLAFFCFVAATSWIARYYLPIYPALTLLAVYSLVTLADTLRKQAPVAKALPEIAVTTAVLLSAFVFAVQIYVSGGVSYLLGTLPRRDFLQGAFYYPPIDYLNQQTPKDAKVMMMGAQMGYHLQRDYLAEAGWDSVEWQRLMIRNQSVEGIHEDLKRQGITHILYSPGLFKFVAQMGRAGSGPSGSMYSLKNAAAGNKDYQVQVRNWATFELYRKNYLESVQSFTLAGSDYTILRLK
jgi:hypothetical protein